MTTEGKAFLHYSLEDSELPLAADEATYFQQLKGVDINYSSYQQVLLSPSDDRVSFHSNHQKKTGNEFHSHHSAV